MRSKMRRYLLYAVPAMISIVILFQNCGPAKIQSGAEGGDLASEATPTLGNRVDLNSLLNSPQEPTTNVLYPPADAKLEYDYSNSAPILETVVFKKNTFDRIEWIHGPSATVVATGESFLEPQFSPEKIGTYYIFGYRGSSSYFIKQFQIVAKSRPTVGVDSANAVSLSQSQVEADASTETVLVTAEAPDVDLKKISFFVKGTEAATDKRAILVSKKLTESVEVAITLSDISGNSTTKTLSLPAKACEFNGTVVMNGSGATAYQTSSVPYGQTCTSQTRTCSNGSLNGTYAYSACTVLPPGACFLDGKTVAHGSTITAFQASSVPYGQSCVSQTRSCSNGTLSGTYPKSSCSALPPSPCSFDGISVAHGASVNAFPTSTVPYGGTCVSQARTCNNGTLSGTNPYRTCSVLPGTNIMNPMAPTTVTAARGAKVSISLLVTRLKATPLSLLGFVHLVPSGSLVASYAVDFEPATPTNAWALNSSIAVPLSITIPADLPVGTYTVRAGFYQRTSPFTRYKLDADAGVTEDGTLRYIVGTITVR